MRNLKSYLAATLVTLGIGLAACDDEGDELSSPDSEASSLTVKFNHTVDGDSLVFGNKQYENEAGEIYSVTKLEYIITDFRLYKSESNYEEIITSHYINPEKTETTTLTLNDLPNGDYQQISFVFGIREERNESGNLPQTDNFANMGWPPNNGGGYHYMRMNGRYDSAGQFEDNFTTHLGHTKKWNLDSMPPTLIKDSVRSYAFEVKLDQSSVELQGENAEMNVAMNVNNWYRQPNTYHFDSLKMEGIMKNQKRQQMLMQNGKGDVFKLRNIVKQ